MDILAIMDYIILFAGGVLVGVVISYQYTMQEVFKVILEHEHDKMMEELERYS